VDWKLVSVFIATVLTNSLPDFLSITIAAPSLVSLKFEVNVFLLVVAAKALGIQTRLI